MATDLLIPDNLSHLKTDDLKRILNDLEKSNTHIKNENMLLSSYVVRGQHEDRRDEDARNEAKKGGKKEKKKETLTDEEKFMIVKDELNYLNKAIEEGKSEASKMLDQLQAVIRGTKEIISGIKREAFDFKRDVVVGAENETGKVIAEQLIKYRNKKKMEKIAITKKFEQKNDNILKQYKKVKEELSKKKDTGDSLKFIDFHQLEIENQKHMKEIDEENKTLLSLKNNYGDINKELKKIKDKVEEKEKELKNLKEDSLNKTKNIENAEEEIIKANNATNSINAAIRDLENKANRWKTDTKEITYIQKKKELNRARKKLDDLKRSCQIHHKLEQVLSRKGQA